VPGTIWIFVEGDDDVRFFSTIVKPVLERTYESVLVYPRAEKKDSKIKAFIEALSASGADYLFVTDYDDGPCVTEKKAYWIARIRSLAPGKVVVVRTEIEAWYLAGLTPEGARRLRIEAPRLTDSVTKEIFTGLMGNRFASRVEFMQILLESFDSVAAVGRNTSFSHFVSKHLPGS
jgi:hypothetical protein